MEKKNNILNQRDRKSGFTTPENYFENFSERMSARLPQREIPDLHRSTLWERVRPLVYMAAMFIGVVLMMKIFTGNGNSKTEGNYSAMNKIASVQDEQLLDDYIYYGNIDEYTIMEAMYSDSNLLQ